MPKEIVIVYQDCFMCGDKDSWSEKAKLAFAQLESAGLPFRKVSFASMEGSAHCAKAIENGVTKMPFYTDGTKYAQTVAELTGAPSEPAKGKKTGKKTAKPTEEQ